MTLLTWLRLIVNRNKGKKSGTRSRSRWNRWRPFFERLEDRTVPTGAQTWNGTGNSLWNNPANWTGGSSYPSAATDTATFPNVSNQTVTVNVNVTVGSVSFTNTTNPYTINNSGNSSLSFASNTSTISVQGTNSVT